MKPAKFALPFALTLALLAPAAAHAFSSVPGHTAPTVKPIKKGGVVVGCTVSFCVKDPSSGYKFSHPRLLTPANVQALRSNQNRSQAIDPALGMIRYAMPTISVPQVGVVHNIDHEIIYGQGNDLKGGEQLELITAWTVDGKEQNATPHVFGTITHNDPNNQLTLPH